YEEEEAEPEERLEGGVAEGVQEGDDGQQRRPTAAGERDRDEDEEEREKLGPQPDRAQHEIGRVAEDAQRNGQSPAAEGPHGVVREHGRDQGSQQRERDDASARGS